jgi:hypothetical protein
MMQIMISEIWVLELGRRLQQILGEARAQFVVHTKDCHNATEFYLAIPHHKNKWASLIYTSSTMV